MKNHSKRKFVFFDRDGTLIHHKHHLSSHEHVEPFQDLSQALKVLAFEGFSLALVTNQSVISRGLATLETVKAINQIVFEPLRKNGIVFQFELICPHLPEDECNCRKPRTGLVDSLKQKNIIDFSNSFMVGDQETDIGFGQALGMKTILISRAEFRKTAADFQVDSLTMATQTIVNDMQI